MELTKENVERIYFLTRTNIPEARIKRLAKYFEDLNQLTDKINKLNHPDLDFDWTLFDFEYINNKIIFAENIKIIIEKDIFKGTYTHKCKNNRHYLIQIISAYGYCRRCDTQFFPKIWWEHPLKKELSYKEIKFGTNIPYVKLNINSNYFKKLISIGVDKRILEKTLSAIHSAKEIEKILNTRYYDWKNPPLASKIHAKLLLLNNVWDTRPVLELGIYQDTKYFFHKCNNKINKILFNEKILYPWCPYCFAKFIPVWDRQTIKNYDSYFTIDTYAPDNGKEPENDMTSYNENTDESFYLSILGLEKNSTTDDINNTFRKLSKIYHPDLGGDSVSFQEIVKAKNWLIKFYK